MGTSSSDKLDTILTKNRVASESLPHAPPSHTAQNHLIPIPGDIGTFLTGKRVIMRCLKKWLILATNSGNTTADWADGGVLTQKYQSFLVKVHFCFVEEIRYYIWTNMVAISYPKMKLENRLCLQNILILV